MCLSSQLTYNSERVSYELLQPWYYGLYSLCSLVISECTLLIEVAEVESWLLTSLLIAILLFSKLGIHHVLYILPCLCLCLTRLLSLTSVNTDDQHKSRSLPRGSFVTWLSSVQICVGICSIWFFPAMFHLHALNLSWCPARTAEPCDVHYAQSYAETRRPSELDFLLHLLNRI